MWIIFIISVVKVLHQSAGSKYIDLSDINSSDETSTDPSGYSPTETTIENDGSTNDFRRYWLPSNLGIKLPPKRRDAKDDEKDDNLKNKISTLVAQTLHDTERKIQMVQKLKERYRNDAPYKIGFILSMVKKSKDVLNELFNVAVRHRDDWKALEQLKVFELIVHTNVDTTNLVRQLVEIHIQHLNATNSAGGGRRVVLLK